MNHTELFAQIKRGEIAPCYLFEGEEEFIKRAALEAVRAATVTGDFREMNDITLTDPDADQIIAAAETLPFLSDRRLVVVKESAMLTGGKAKGYDEAASARRLDEYLNAPAPHSTVVFYVRGKVDARKKLCAALRKKAAAVTFAQPDDVELTKWIAKRLAMTGKRIEAATCKALIYSVGRDMTLLANELDKLSAYAGDREVVGIADIDAVCTRATEARVFDLATALMLGEGARAFAMLSTLLREGESRLMLLTLLGRQARQASYAKWMAAQGQGQGAIAATIGVPIFAVEKTLHVARRYTDEQLGDIAQLCMETEFEVKSGALPENGSLESVMLRILSMKVS